MAVVYMRKLELEPSTYDLEFSSLLKHRTQEIYAKILDQIKSDQRILEVGCGPGKLASQLAKKAKEVVAIDHNTDMIHHAQQQFSKEVFPNLHFLIGDAIEFYSLTKHDPNAELLPSMQFLSAPFDVVITTFMLSELRPLEQQIFLRTVWYLLVPGGKLILAEEFEPHGIWYPFYFLRRQKYLRKLGQQRYHLHPLHWFLRYPPAIGYNLLSQQGWNHNSLRIYVYEKPTTNTNPDPGYYHPIPKPYRGIRALLCRIRCIFTGQIDLVPIEPGIYPHGSPTVQSPILFTANYELTYIQLRYDLGKLDAWIVCVDSRGINVWCAARGPDFGNKQILEVINATNLKQLTDHHRILLPQLAAGGVALPKLPKKSPAFPFQFSYGPIWSKYLPEYLQSPHHQKTPQISRANFNFFHRTRAGVTHTTFLLRKIFIFPILVLLLLGFLLSPSWVELAVELLVVVIGMNFIIAWGFPISRFTRHFIIKGILFGGIGSVLLTIGYALFRHSLWIAFLHFLFYFWVGFFSTMSFSGYTFDTGPGEIANEYPLFNKIHLITFITSLLIIIIGSLTFDPLFRLF